MFTHSSHAVVPLALVAGTMVLAAAACGGNVGQTPSSTAPAGASTSASTSAGAPGTTSAASTSSAPSTSNTASSPSANGGGAGGGGCAVAELKVRYADDEGGAGAGSVMGTLTFTNTGTTSCTLAGFPGVSYVGGGNGTQIGQPATRTGDAVKTRTLAPGDSVKAALRRTQPRNYGDACQQAPVDGFRVYPPNSTEAVLVRFRTTGCKSTSAPLLQVGPVR